MTMNNMGPRTFDTHCRIHNVNLDSTGWCSVAQAWWYPKFRCPECAGTLWDNGYCANCTPETRMFMGDYFEQRWGSQDRALPGQDDETVGHYVRVHRGPTPAIRPPLDLSALKSDEGIA